MAYVASNFSQIDDVQQLAQLVAEEFGKIEDEIASAQGSASLIHDLVLTPFVANIVPNKILVWTQQRPNRDFRAVVPNQPDGEIIAAREGLYLVNFTVTATITSQREYEGTVFINGVASLLKAVNDPSNQSTFITMVATGSARVPRESERSVVDLRISADQDGAQFDIGPSFLTVAWVGD